MTTGEFPEIMLEFLQFLAGTWWGITIYSVAAIAIWLLLSTVLYRPFFKRFYDIVLSGAALIIFSPLLLLMYVLVRKNLGKPTMFNQYRPGKNKKMFVMHKFRTMTSKTDENGELLPDAERMTKFGKFIRSTSLDELPQLWDIFCGKMSIVGPRPQLMKNLVFLTEEEFVKRHKVRPGLTGLAQVNGRNNLSWKDRFAYDFHYSDHLSFWLDVKIFFKTVMMVLRRKDIVMDGTVTSCDYGDELLSTQQISQDEYGQNIKLAHDIMENMAGERNEKNTFNCQLG